MRRLYHFTCDDGAERILTDGHLRPQTAWPAVIAGVRTGMEHAAPVVWLTDIPDPKPHEVGVTSELLTCDRLAHRFEVETRAWPWAAFATLNGCTDDYWAMLAGSPEARPDLWFVTTRPGPVTPDSITHVVTEREASDG